MYCTPPGNVFCYKHEACIDPENCQNNAGPCCNVATSTTTTVTTVTSTTTIATFTSPEDFSCDNYCVGRPVGQAGECCSSNTCYCMGDDTGVLLSCRENEGWCVKE